MRNVSHQTVVFVVLAYIRSVSARTQFEAVIFQWEEEMKALVAISEDPITSPELRVRCITSSAKLLTKMQTLVARHDPMK